MTRIRDPRIVIAACAHALVTAAAILAVVTSTLGLAARVALSVLIAAVLLPGLRTLLAGRSERFARLALLLVLVIGAALVEVFASRGGLQASILLGAAMLEFALLFSMTRPGRRRERNAPERQ